MRRFHWLWLPLIGGSVYLAGQLRVPEERPAAVTLEIHSPSGLAAPDATALAEMLYVKEPELRGQISITPAEELDHFVIAANNTDATAALTLAKAAAESLQGLIGEHFQASFDERLDTLKADIEAQKQRVEKSRRKMLELMEKNEIGSEEDKTIAPVGSGCDG